MTTIKERQAEIDNAIIAWAEETYPNLAWSMIHDLDRAINWELWHGPLPENYWTYVEPMDTPWPGFVEACDQLTALMEDLPSEVWYDGEWGGCTLNDPDDDEDNYQWSDDYQYDVWVGSDMWGKHDVRKAILLTETWKQVF